MPQASSDFGANGPRCCLRCVPPIIQIPKDFRLAGGRGQILTKNIKPSPTVASRRLVRFITDARTGTSWRCRPRGPYESEFPIKEVSRRERRVRNSKQRPISLLSGDSRRTCVARCGGTATAYARCTRSGMSSWERSRMRFDRYAMDVLYRLPALPSAASPWPFCIRSARLNSPTPRLYSHETRAFPCTRYLSCYILPPLPFADVKAPPMTFNEGSMRWIGAEAGMNRPLMANFRSFVSLAALGTAISLSLFMQNR